MSAPHLCMPCTPNQSHVYGLPGTSDLLIIGIARRRALCFFRCSHSPCTSRLGHGPLSLPGFLATAQALVLRVASRFCQCYAAVCTKLVQCQQSLDIMNSPRSTDVQVKFEIVGKDTELKLGRRNLNAFTASTPRYPEMVCLYERNTRRLYSSCMFSAHANPQHGSQGAPPAAAMSYQATVPATSHACRIPPTSLYKRPVTACNFRTHANWQSALGREVVVMNRIAWATCGAA